jgi:hypothetical protein
MTILLNCTVSYDIIAVLNGKCKEKISLARAVLMAAAGRGAGRFCAYAPCGGWEFPGSCGAFSSQAALNPAKRRKNRKKTCGATAFSLNLAIDFVILQRNK